MITVRFLKTEKRKQKKKRKKMSESSQSAKNIYFFEKDKDVIHIYIYRDQGVVDTTEDKHQSVIRIYDPTQLLEGQPQVQLDQWMYYCKVFKSVTECPPPPPKKKRRILGIPVKIRLHVLKKICIFQVQ